MANVIFRVNGVGKLVLYVPKKDLEDVVASLEFDAPGQWGGEVWLADGSGWYVEPLPGTPRFPLETRVKRLERSVP